MEIVFTIFPSVLSCFVFVTTASHFTNSVFRLIEGGEWKGQVFKLREENDK